MKHAHRKTVVAEVDDVAGDRVGIIGTGAIIMATSAMISLIVVVAAAGKW